jgi:hypothetical protein
VELAISLIGTTGNVFDSLTGFARIVLPCWFLCATSVSHLEEVSTVRGSGWVKRSFQNPSQFRMVIGNPSATADGTDFFQVRFWTFEAKQHGSIFVRADPWHYHSKKYSPHVIHFDL